METDSSTHTIDNTMYPSSTSQAMMSRFLHTTTAADALPLLMNSIVTNGKMAALVVVGVYLALVLLWLPFWLLAYVLTEIGVYLFMMASIVFFGRCVIRFIAFPGSSQRVAGEIETEFARYSVRMLQTAANCLIDLCSAILKSTSTGGTQLGTLGGYYDIPGVWKRTISYRDRVLGVYLDVLLYLYQNDLGDRDRSKSGMTTQYGNNRVSGDIGNLTGLTAQARTDGRLLVTLLQRILSDLTQIERGASSLLSNDGRLSSPQSLAEETKHTLRLLLNSATELRDLVASFKPQSSSDTDDREDSESGPDDADASIEAVQRRLEQETTSVVESVKSVVGSIVPMLDPPPHSSIFGLDVMRGCVLSRYRGAQQFWVRRPSGGRIDALHIPAQMSGSTQGQKRKAVLYCNPNAGLIEVATGMSLAGGNVSPDDSASDKSWTDFYTQNGYDVFLFNYAGFGRSHGAMSCSSGNTVYVPGLFASITRIFRSTFLTFKPTPESLRADAIAVGTHIVTEAGFDELIIHGESIGGLAASGAARALSHSSLTKNKLALLICDRTFCNLEAVAQRLVGGWSGPAIRALAPFWSTDVAADFLAAACPKIVANDSADSIIADAASLKAGISLSKEIRRGISTKGVGWKVDAPIVYRMADWENVGVTESAYVDGATSHIRPPIWPADKYIALQEGFHFAACARRIGKVATAERKLRSMDSSSGDEEEGFEVCELGAGDEDSVNGLVNFDVVAAWKMLSCCDGLCGSPLGAAVKNGYDCTLTWICCTLTFGGQIVACTAEKRAGQGKGPILHMDFDTRPNGYQQQESAMVLHPKPIPEVIEGLKRCLGSGDGSIKGVEHELKFCIGVLEYVVARLSSSSIVEVSQKGSNLDDSFGAFMDLHCGHNNPFSLEEQQRLRGFLDLASSKR